MALWGKKNPEQPAPPPEPAPPPPPNNPPPPSPPEPSPVPGAELVHPVTVIKLIAT